MSDLIRRSDAIKAMEQRYQDILRIFKRKVKDGEKAIALDMIGCVKSLPSADRPQGKVNAVMLYEQAISDLEHGKITLGEYETRIEPLMHLYYDRPQGEWRKHDEERDYCSRCKHIFKTRTITKQDKWTQYIDDLRYNFCPNCGARMKGADDDSKRD